MFEVSTLTSLYYSFVYPYVTYCIEVYDTAANMYVQLILKLQKLRCRIITNSHNRTLSAPFDNNKIVWICCYVDNVYIVYGYATKAYWEDI